MGGVGDKDRGFRCGAHIGEEIEAVVDEEWRVRPQILLLLQGIVQGQEDGNERAGGERAVFR